MNEQKLSKRLGRVAHYVRENDRVADIGSDHAYLPAWLILNQKIEFAVAGEVVQGPYQSALKIVKEKGLAEQLTVRLGNGLDAVELSDQITAITIAGMGGSLISEILEGGYQSGRLTGKERLILQPNVGEKTLRSWLMSHCYQIIAEELISEDGKLYEIIVAEKVEKEKLYSLDELTFGPYLMIESGQLFVEKWQRESQQKEQVLSQLNQAKSVPQAKVAEIKEQINLIQSVLGK